MCTSFNTTDFIQKKENSNYILSNYYVEAQRSEDQQAVFECTKLPNYCLLSICNLILVLLFFPKLLYTERML